MRREVTHWCRACITCATRSVGRPLKPLLVPIPVHWPFDRVGVGVAKTKKGNRYVVVFMDYLTKWPEAFATQDKTALTISKLFVEKIVSRHGVPNQLKRQDKVLNPLRRKLLNHSMCRPVKNKAKIKLNRPVMRRPVKINRCLLFREVKKKTSMEEATEAENNQIQLEDKLKTRAGKCNELESRYAETIPQ